MIKPLKLLAIKPRIGCSALLMLFVVVSSFSAGLPGEYQTTQRWRELFGLHSTVSNPAFVTEEDYVSMRGAWASSMQNAFNFWELGLIVPVALFQSVGFTWLGKDDGKNINKSMFSGSGAIVADPDAASLQNATSLFMLSYAVNPWRKLSIGANLNYVYETGFGDPIMGVGLDLGLSYILLEQDKWGKHVMGVATQNLIAPSMNAKLSQAFVDTGAYSRNLIVSWNGRFAKRQFEGGLDFNLKDFMAAKEEFKDGKPTLDWQLSARLGVWFMQMVNVYAQAGFNKYAFDYWGLAAGVNLPHLNSGRDAQFLYQYNQKVDQAEATMHTFYARANVGKHRQESFRGLMKFSANDLYTKACDLYWKGDYWDAFFVFGQVQEMFPNFFKMDWVEFYLGSCQQKLDMRGIAKNRLQAVKGKYPMSAMVPLADLGLLRIHYRDGSLPDVTNEYLELNKPGVPDSMKYEAYYLMGEAYLANGRYADAVRVLNEVPERNYFYMFAQHSAGIAYYAQGDTANAIQSMATAAQATGKTRDQKEIIARSCALLGYLYFESGQLSKAVTALRLVDKGSYYYEDALLGLGWTAIKAQQWEDCARIGGELQGLTKHMVVKGEAAIIQSYGLLGQKRWDDALSVFKPIYDTLQTMSGPREDSLEILRAVYAEDRQQYERFASEMDAHSRELATQPLEPNQQMSKVNKEQLRDQSSSANRVLDSLEQIQIGEKKKLDTFMDYQDGHNRRLFFSHNRESVKNDVNYIYAVVQRHTAQTTAKKIQSSSEDKTSEIDSELEKLKKEAAQLEEKGAGKVK